MARQSSTARLDVAWRALSLESSERAGWSTIALDTRATCRVLAGRHFPGNEEAIIFGFHETAVPTVVSLPEGQGFRMHRIESATGDPTKTWIALARQPNGSLELFEMMAADVVETVAAAPAETTAYRWLIERVQAWQHFMQRNGPNLLDSEAELGLFGELLTLKMLVDKGISPGSAVDMWKGPVGGSKDFEVGTGGFEVKSSVSSDEFVAKVGSLEQLDDSFRRPLFVCAVRLKVVPTGQRLPDLIEELRSRMNEAGVINEFDNRLIRTGFVPVAAERYTRRFQHIRTQTFAVDDQFPRLTPAAVPVGIIRARYEINLEQARSDVSFDDALEQLRGM